MKIPNQPFSGFSSRFRTPHQNDSTPYAHTSFHRTRLHLANTGATPCLPLQVTRSSSLSSHTCLPLQRTARAHLSSSIFAMVDEGKHDNPRLKDTDEPDPDTFDALDSRIFTDLKSNSKAALVAKATEKNAHGIYVVDGKKRQLTKPILAARLVAVDRAARLSAQKPISCCVCNTHYDGAPSTSPEGTGELVCPTCVEAMRSSKKRKKCSSCSTSYDGASCTSCRPPTHGTQLLPLTAQPQRCAQPTYSARPPRVYIPSGHNTVDPLIERMVAMGLFVPIRHLQPEQLDIERYEARHQRLFELAGLRAAYDQDVATFGHARVAPLTFDIPERRQISDGPNLLLALQILIDLRRHHHPRYSGHDEDDFKVIRRLALDPGLNVQMCVRALDSYSARASAQNPCPRILPDGNFSAVELARMFCPSV